MEAITNTTSADDAWRIYQESKLELQVPALEAPRLRSLTEAQNDCPECHGVDGHRDPFCTLLDLSSALADACEHCGGTEDLKPVACAGGAVGDFYLCPTAYGEHLRECEECGEGI